MSDVVGVVVGLVVTLTVVVWPWIAAASVGGFEQATWQAVGRSKPAWFAAVLLVPMVGSCTGWWCVPSCCRRQPSSSQQGQRPKAGQGLSKRLGPRPLPGQVQ